MPIRIRLLIIFLAIGIIPMAFVGAMSFFNAREAIKDDRLAELETIATLKAKTVEDFFKGLEQDMMIIQDYYNIKHNLPVITRLSEDRTNPEYIASKKMLNDQLRAWAGTKKGIIDFMLVNLDGKIVYGTNEAHETRDLGNPLADPDGRAFQEGKKGIYFTDVFRNKVEDDNLGMLIAAPAHDFNGKLAGVIVLEVDTDFIYELIQDTTGLGQTGETLIGKKAGNKALFLNPLRHDKNAALKRKAILGGKDAIPLQEAVQGRSGSGISVDYRGEEIIAAWRHIPFLNWGLVAKMDTKEAFAGVERIKHLSVGIGVVMVFLIGGVAFITSKSITDPLEVLVEATDRIGAGALDTRVEIKTEDEIGRLARSFNQMVDDLQKTTTSRALLALEVEARKNAQEKESAVNQQLKANEQQLKAANQQLRANEQQVKAFNQQLKANEEALVRTQKELEERISDLEEFNKLAVGRELRMVELKERIKELEEKLKEHG